MCVEHYLFDNDPEILIKAHRTRNKIWIRQFQLIRLIAETKKSPDINDLWGEIHRGLVKQNNK